MVPATTADAATAEHIRMNLDMGLMPELYGDVLEKQLPRYAQLLDRIRKLRPASAPVYFISAPGRTELGGNHTDHNQGKVLCAAVDLDTVAAVTPANDGKIVVESDGFDGLFTVDLAHLDPVVADEGATTALIRGVAAGLKQRGHTIGGFRAVVNSDVPVGAGLSSSASFEILIGGIFNELYNHGQLTPEILAQVGQYAENVHFGKACGLMDQLACAVGGVIVIDLADPQTPAIRRMDAPFAIGDYELVIVQTGSGHADLTDAYAAIPAEMKAVARYLGGAVLSDVSEDALRSQLVDVRQKTGDRATLRALHFYSENRRVDRMAAALIENDFDTYLSAVAASGASSVSALQNIIPPDKDGQDQPVAVALWLSNAFLEAKGRGVCRVHGGGFAGSIQAYLHRDDLPAYRGALEAVFGIGSVIPLRVRSKGICLAGMTTAVADLPDSRHTRRK